VPLVSQIPISGANVLLRCLNCSRVALLTTITVGVLLSVSVVQAQSLEDVVTACNDAASMAKAGDIRGAIEEAEWCLEGLRQQRANQSLSVFPDEVAGFTGGEIDNQSALGMTMIERSYSRDGDTITLATQTGAASGGLAALAQLGMSIGASAGTKMRIQKRTVIDLSDAADTNAEFMVELRSGGMLMVSSDTVPPDQVIGFLKAFPLQELDESLDQ